MEKVFCIQSILAEKYLMLTHDLDGALARLDSFYEKSGYKTDNPNMRHKLPGGLRLYEVQEIYERAKSKLEKLLEKGKI